jgi:hypothetical protein
VRRPRSWSSCARSACNSFTSLSNSARETCSSITTRTARYCAIDTGRGWQAVAPQHGRTGRRWTRPTNGLATRNPTPKRVHIKAAGR